MKIRFAQFGISHDHAPSKARTLKASEDIDFVGIYEPSAEARETLGINDAFEGVRWLSSAEEVLDDESIVGIAAQDVYRKTLILHGRRSSAESTSGLTNRQAMIWKRSGRS